MFPKGTDLIQDPKEIWVVNPALENLTKIKQISWQNIDEAGELEELITTRIGESKAELDQKLEKLVELDREIKELKESIK
jgi:hypothetical protein